ncbi:MAG: aromatic acid decarboxylase [Candidatus Terraquivivens tikiterensis]|uniref:Flavin prenyltransferase UbiX n=1 Tax=Candidatus Terraquivivens tikiterensis TaxID=1980982 RepID=A0A2R7Y5D4_9ARCH|nr:MAG: aromatic acid decarboxylase [Candidatus Terraquivivens tikiterensis]
MRIIVAITGASGAPVAERLLEVLKKGKHQIYLIISKNGEAIVRAEADLAKVKSYADRVFREDELEAPISSGSFPIDAMVVVPCSMKTLAEIANGVEENLIVRAALVSLKQRRKLVLVPRETPLAEPYIVNMLKATRAGAVVLLPVLTFYHSPRTVQDLIDFIVGRVLEILGIEHNLYKRWGNEGFSEGA